MEFKRKKIEGRLYKIMKLTKTKSVFIKKKLNWKMRQKSADILTKKEKINT